MDEKFRESMLGVSEHWKKKVLNASDLNEAVKAMTGYKMSADLILKYDMAVDSHDENVEKIDNAQLNEEKKLEMEQQKIDLESNRLENDISATEAKLNIEKERLEQEKEINEEKAKSESKWRNKEFWKDVAKAGLTIGASVGITALAFYFDGKGVLFTSTAGKQIIPSVARNLSNSLKL